ncbi:MAG: hypothetical protein IH867_07600 [Chloroflexi bacterium]|nr:hypothetical protein [Chloroflexota bacterium]
MHARYDSKKTTAKARESFLSKFELLVDPDMTLDPLERHTRAAHARKAHFMKLGFRSAEARQKKSDE